MNALIVGGAGYLGGAVTDILAERQISFTVYDNLLYEEVYRKDVRFVYGDVRDRGKLLQIIRDFDVVVWLAALVGDTVCQRYPELSEEINANTLKWLADHYDGRIIFTSTCSVYGDRSGKHEVVEDDQKNPLSVYATTKLQAEKNLDGKNCIIFRFGTLYGLGDLFSRIRLDLVVNAFVVQAYYKNSITVFGGDQFRPLLHVSDAARAIVNTLHDEHVGIYNLHADNLTIANLAQKLKEFFPALLVNFRSPELSDHRNYSVSSEKAKRDLLFAPTRAIDDGVLEILSLVETGRLVDPMNPRFSNGKFLTTKAVERLEAFRG